jgi:hypothetical protein
MNKLVFPVCLLILLSFTMIGVTMVQAQATVGVKKGDEFEYTTYSNFHSDFLDTPPSDLVELNQTQWERVTVTDVSGSKISVQVLKHFRNGTEDVQNGFCDVDTGETTVAQVAFIGANLNIYDAINPSASEPYYVNATLFRDYAGGQRETNLLEFDVTDENEQVGTYTRITRYYFDKATGVLVEFFYDFYYTGLETIVRFDLVSSSLWVVPEFPAWIVLPLFVTGALAALAFKRNAFKRNLHHLNSV